MTMKQRMFLRLLLIYGWLNTNFELAMLLTALTGTCVGAWAMWYAGPAGFWLALLSCLLAYRKRPRWTS